MPFYTDQIGERIELTEVPVRIISLVPSQTELLHHLGLNEEVIGITKFCVHPKEWFDSKIRVGGTKSVNIDKVNKLVPDLIICNKEENTEEQVRELRTIAPVWTSDINTYEDALDMIKSISAIVGKKANGEHLIQDIELAFKRIGQDSKGSCLYFIWKDPDFVVGQKTYINAMLEKCGFENMCQNERYPQVQMFSLDHEPKFIFLSTEPFPFKEEHRRELQLRYPSATVKIVDGEMFSWYGSRMRLLPDYLEVIMK